MPFFAYTARETATGREIRNSVEAATEQAAIAALLNRNLLVVEIREKTAKRGQTKGGKVSLNDLVVFTRQLATMIDAGILMPVSPSSNPCKRWPIKRQTKSCAIPSAMSARAWKPVKVFPKP